MRRRPVMTFSFSGPYLSAMRSVPCGPSLDAFEVLDEAFVLEDLGDRLLCPRSRNVDRLVVGRVRVADARQHIGDRIGYYCHVTSNAPLPRRLGHAGNEASVRVLAEADAAHGKLAQVAARAAADAAAVVPRTANFGLRFDLTIKLVLAITWTPLFVLRGADQARVGRLALCSGSPIASRNAVASSSFLAVVTITMSMPRALSTLSKLISGNTSCSRRPML